MGFFARGEGPDEGQRSEELARIEGGGIPSRAAERLKNLGTPGPDGSLFTSGLSVNEFALLRRMGPEPLAQVMGASVVRTGWQYLPALDPTLNAFTSAMRYGGPGPTGYTLTNRYGEPSMAQVRNYKWRWSVVCELHTLSDAWNLARRPPAPFRPRPRERDDRVRRHRDGDPDPGLGRDLVAGPDRRLGPGLLAAA